jgi:hypothetical protein
MTGEPNIFSLMECPHCEVYGSHQLARAGDEKTFQCALCFVMFTDAEAVPDHR